MKKWLVYLLLIAPVFLSASIPVNNLLPKPLIQGQQSDQTILEKSKNSKGKELVTEIWTLVRHHQWDRLKSKMSKNFQGINVLGTVSDRKQEITWLKGLDIQNTTFVPTFLVTHLGHNALSVQYQVNMTIQSVPGVPFPDVRLSEFQKEHGKWVWKSDADLSIFITGP